MCLRRSIKYRSNALEKRHRPKFDKLSDMQQASLTEKSGALYLRRGVSTLESLEGPSCKLQGCLNVGLGIQGVGSPHREHVAIP